MVCRGWLKGHNWGVCKKCGLHHIHPNLGRHWSEEMKQRISNSEKGKKLSEKHKQILSARWKKNNPNYDPVSRAKITAKNKTKIRTEEFKQYLSNIKKGKKTWMYGKKHSEKTKEIIRIKRLHQIIPIKDTKPEKMMQLALQLNGIKFQKHKPIIGQPDIFIEPNICLFVDGCYWHGCKQCFPNKLNEVQIKNIERDHRIHYELNLKGFQVIRVLEHDIMNDNGQNAHNIINLIREIQGRIRE
jgi:DNA mismatch endonuclease (patch repair protein)